MIRVVRQADGHVRIDPTGKQPGRGAYLHMKPACWQSALTGGRLAHALKIAQIDEADRAELQAYLAMLSKEDGTAV